MNADKILQELKQLNTKVDGLQEGQKSLQVDVRFLQEGQKSLHATVEKQGEMLAGQGETLTRHGKLLSGITGTLATVLEEQQAQRTDIRSLHTELHASKEELREEILSSREEAKRDTMDLKATVVKQLKDHEKRLEALEDATGIPNPNKH